jgi:hypothetical protein
MLEENIMKQEDEQEKYMVMKYEKRKEKIIMWLALRMCRGTTYTFSLAYVFIT